MWLRMADAPAGPKFGGHVRGGVRWPLSDNEASGRPGPCVVGGQRDDGCPNPGAPQAPADSPCSRAVWGARGRGAASPVSTRDNPMQLEATYRSESRKYANRHGARGECRMCNSPGMAGAANQRQNWPPSARVGGTLMPATPPRPPRQPRRRERPCGGGGRLPKNVPPSTSLSTFSTSSGSCRLARSSAQPRRPPPSSTSMRHPS
jgi:hypothetical protein